MTNYTHEESIKTIQANLILNDAVPIRKLIERHSTDLSPLFLQCSNMCLDMIEGNYLQALSNLENSGLEYSRLIHNVQLANEGSTLSVQALYDQLDKEVTRFISESDSVERSWFVMLCGALALNVFVQMNFTGPPIADLRPVLFATTESESELQRFAIDKLSIDGEIAYRLTAAPHYLLLSKIFLERAKEQRFEKILNTFNWWAFRSACMHQQILSHQVPQLNELCYDYAQVLSKEFEINYIKAGELIARLKIELGLMYHTYYKYEMAQNSFQEAKRATGLYTKLSGALGVRTKFQSFKTAQLQLIAKSRIVADVTDEKEEVLPEEVPFSEDNELLPTISFDDNEDSDSDEEDNDGDESLRMIDQSIILALCIDVKNTNPKDGLTTEEMFPYVNKVHEEPKNWMIFTTCLLIKSRLEAERNRTAERSVLQLQVLSQQYKDVEPGPAVRMSYIYNLPFPPLFDINRELADRFMSLGAARSALEIFERLQMWDDIIKCYVAMSKENKAKRVTLERIKSDPTDPTLWCVLGDLKQGESTRKQIDFGDEYKEFELETPEEYYRRAWEISKCRLARAMRSLAQYYVKVNQYAESIVPFEQALALSPLYAGSWFTYGVACMRTDNWEKALGAFTRSIQIEPDDGDSWSNLASVHMKLGNKPKAFSALQVALKHKYDSWRIWENMLFLSIDLNDFQNALFSINRLVELKIDKNVDLKVLVLIIRAYHQIWKYNVQFAEKLKVKLEEVLASVANRITMNAQVWNAYALFYEIQAMHIEENENKQPEDLLEHVELMSKVVEMNQKHLRTVQISGWESESGKFSDVCDSVKRLVSSQIRTVESIKSLPSTCEITNPDHTIKHQLTSAILALRPVINRSAEHFKDSAERNSVIELLRDVEQQLATSE